MKYIYCQKDDLFIPGSTLYHIRHEYIIRDVIGMRATRRDACDYVTQTAPGVSSSWRIRSVLKTYINLCKQPCNGMRGMSLLPSLDPRSCKFKFLKLHLLTF